MNRVFPGVEKVQPPVFELNRADFAPLAGRGMDRPRRALKILRTVENVRRPVDADQDSIERVFDREDGKIDDLPNRNRIVFFGISVRRVCSGAAAERTIYEKAFIASGEA